VFEAQEIALFWSFKQLTCASTWPFRPGPIRWWHCRVAKAFTCSSLCLTGARHRPGLWNTSLPW